MLLIAKNRLLKVHRKCVCFLNEIYSCLPQNDKLRNLKFFEGLFFSSQPTAKLNLKLSIPIGKQTDKNTGKYRATTGRAAA